MSALTQVTASDVGLIALGGAFLATGGGGDTLLGEIMAETALDAFGPVSVMPLDQLADDALVVAIGSSGAPTIMQEKPSNGEEAGWALDLLETHLGRKADALISFEAGGVNALMPFCAAAPRDLPVLDADGMGRAFPELQMESFSIYGVSATPLVMAAELGDRVLIEHARDSATAEKLVRHFGIVAGGGGCVSAEHVMDGMTARRVSIPNTISLCRDIGALLEAHGNHIEAFTEALAVLLAPTHYGAVRTLFTGKVVDMARRVVGGYDVGEARLTSFDDPDHHMVISIKNEYLLAMSEKGKDRRPAAMTPDLISLLDHETGRAITAETLRYGQRVTVLGVGAPALMRTPRALEVVAPRNFGFDMPYTPIEEISAP